MSPPLLRAFLQFPVNLVRVFRQERLPQVAASLAFSTLLSLVPLVTLVLVVASSLPAFNLMVGRLDNLLMETLLPGKPGGAVANQIFSVAQKARSLTGPWVLALAGMVFLMLHTMERAFNQIWGVREGRTWLRRLPLYLLGMLGVPLLMGGLTSLVSFLVNLSLGWLEGGTPLRAMILKGAYLVLTAGFFSLLYFALPNARVARRSALWGGSLVALALSLLQYGFSLYLAKVSFYAKLYGTFASLPIFLVWLYLYWALVLAGGVLVATLDGITPKHRPRY